MGTPTVVILLILKVRLRAFQAKSSNLTCLPGALKAGPVRLSGALAQGYFGSAYPYFWGRKSKSTRCGLQCSLGAEGPGLSSQTETPYTAPPFLQPCRLPALPLIASKRRTRICASRRPSRPTRRSTTTTTGSWRKSMTAIGR